MSTEEATTLVLGEVMSKATLGVAALLREVAVDDDGGRGGRWSRYRVIVEARTQVAGRRGAPAARSPDVVADSQEAVGH